jgi:hypothetical protein
MKALRITPAKARFPGSAAAVSMLTAEQVVVMDRAAMQVAAGQSIADLTAIITRPRTAVNAADEAQGPEISVPNRTKLLARMEAADGAIRSGLPLTTAQVAWIIGAQPGAPLGATVTRGRLIATHHKTNIWSLARIEP